MEKELVLYNVEEVAAILKVSKRTVFRLLHSGRLHAAKIGSAWRISEANLTQFLQEREQN